MEGNAGANDEANELAEGFLVIPGDEADLRELPEKRVVELRPAPDAREVKHVQLYRERVS